MRPSVRAHKTGSKNSRPKNIPPLSNERGKRDNNPTSSSLSLIPRLSPPLSPLCHSLTRQDDLGRWEKERESDILCCSSCTRRVKMVLRPLLWPDYEHFIGHFVFSLCLFLSLSLCLFLSLSLSFSLSLSPL